MGRKNASGFAWKTALVAETPIGVYVLCPAKRGAADVFFERTALEHCKTEDAAKARCEAHYDELKHILKPSGVRR